MDLEGSRSSGQSLLGDAPAPLALCVRGGPRDGQILHLPSRKSTIGAARRSTVRLRGAGVHPTECLILRGACRTIIRRGQGTALLNGEQFVDAPLSAGDRLSFGPLTLEVLDLPEAECPPTNPLATIDALEAPQNIERSTDEATSQMQITAGPQRVRDLRKTAQRLRTARARMAELQRTADDLRRKADEASRQMQSLRAERELWATEQAARQLDFQHRTEKLTAAETAAEDANRRWGESLEALARERADVDEQRQALERLAAEQHERLAAESQALEAERVAHEEQLAAVRAELDAERNELEQARRDLEAQREAIEKQRQSLEDAQRQKSELQSSSAEIDLAWKTFYDEQARASDERARAAEELAAREAALEQRIAEADAAAKARESELAEREASLNDQRRELERRQAEWEQKHAAETERLASEEARLAELRDQLASQQAELAKEREAFEKMRETALAEGRDPSLPVDTGVGEVDVDAPATPPESNIRRLAEEHSRWASDRLRSEEASSEPQDESESLARNSTSPQSASELLKKLGFTLPDVDDDEPVDTADQNSIAQQPAPHLTSAAEDASEQNNDDDSIDDYMQQLLARVGGRSLQENSTAAPSAPSPRRIEEPRYEPREIDEAERPQLLSDPSEMTPRAQAPERSVNLDAMRELANLNARTSIDRAVKSRMRATTTGKAMVMGLALMVAVLLLYWTAMGVEAALYPAIVAIAVAVIWGLQYVFLFKQMNASRTEQNVGDAALSTEESDDEPETDYDAYDAEPDHAEAVAEATAEDAEVEST